ncbi:ATPase family gene 2 protein homolog A-like [Saccoglossus kowalevskii]|uniref:Spermatogenesis-associated protein 5-like n=1 Tax=Saccoglossus kowalevskii TaxID=10224 RepID=A0ABM0GTK6_SACKO|nr:PREDICTED: spermatogenesis-associated protein 5-like [Saccoglossus kowalevskii]
MPPKRKGTRTEWVQCTICDALFSSKDISTHCDVCKDNSTEDGDHVVMNVKHGHIRGTTFFAIVHTSVDKVDERLPATIRQDMVQLNPSTMKMCGICIGKQVIVTSDTASLICTAWPVVTIPASYVGMNEHMKKLYNIKSGGFVSIEKLSASIIAAKEIVLIPRVEFNFLDTANFQAFLLKHFNEKFVTIGNKLELTYFGKPCLFKIVKIVGTDGTKVSLDQSEFLDCDNAQDNQSSSAAVLACSDTSVESNVLLTSINESLSMQSFTDANGDNLSADQSDESPLNESELSDKFSSLDLTDNQTSTPQRTSNVEKLMCRRTSPSDVRQKTIHKDLHVFTISSETRTVMQRSSDKNVEELKNKRKEVGYFSIGGLSKQLEILREMVELPLRSPEVFESLGIVPPRGVLLYGPPGTGKTLIAKAIANETKAYFTTINGPEVLSKFYGETESKLREIFKESERQAPAVIFIDEIDALCPKRENVHSELEKRIVATLLTLMDGMSSGNSTGHVIVLGATNRPDSIDTALRRPGRFDRDIEISIPNMKDRKDILQKLLLHMPHDLTDLDIDSIAESAHGYVGADLAAVCKEAGLHAFKKHKRLAVSDTGESDNTVIGKTDFVFALKEIKPSAMREITIDVPKVLWTDIGGQAIIKQKLRQAVEWPLRHPEVFHRMGIEPPQGVLLYGPPGCSKTMIVKALATETQLNFIAVKGPELFSKWVGESERAVREVFRKARAASPAIVFFDEIDALASSRGGSSGSGQVTDRVLAQLLTELDGIEKLTDVTIVAATNRPDVIDKALLRPGRIDRILYVPLPDEQTRREILQIQFRKMPIGSDVSLESLVGNTGRYSGAEVVAVCHEAALAAMQEDIHAEFIMERHFKQALLAVTPRITEDLIEFYEQYKDISGLHTV